MYLRPSTAFVARFVGSANVADAALAQKLGLGAPFAIRAENIDVQAESANLAPDSVAAPGAVVAVQFHGAASRWQVQLESGEVWSALLPDSRRMNGLTVGSRVKLTWPRAAAVPLASTAG